MQVQGNDDLSLLQNASVLTNDEVVGTLVDRYEQRPHSQPYTNIGDRLLVAFNPNESQESSSDQVALQYADDYRDTSASRQPLPPHIFKVAEQAYLHMRRTGLSQSINFIGASGSGKTEQRRLVTRFFSVIRAHSKKDTRLYSRIQNADIVLEAFSHAKTAVHNNGSRMGSYIELQFDERGRTVGTKTLTYLLEKARVTHVPQGERSFHVFYYLTNGAATEEGSEYGITQASFDYLHRPGTVQRITGFSDSERFQELVAAMGSIGLGQKYRRHIFTVLASILALGNLQFQHQKQGEESAATVRNQDVAIHVSEMLGIPVDTLLSLLTIQTKQVGSDKFTVYLDGKGAAARRDDLARSLYSLLFNWLVEFLNSKLCRDDADNSSFISMVDFPGWYTARQSGYEQLCRNYANERLHHFLFHQMFEAGSNEYTAEGITDIVPVVEFANRSQCLDLFMKPKSGLFSTMDRQAAEYLQIDKGGKKKDASAQREFNPNLPEREAGNQLLKAFNRQHDHRSGEANPFYSSSDSKNEMNSFTVSHFWGDVSYSIDDFVEKNLDQLSSDFVAVFRGDGTAENPGTDNGFVAGLFSNKTLATEVHPKDEKAVVQAQAPSVPTRSPSMMRPKTRGATSRFAKVDCVATQFQRALNEMVMTLDDTLTWFVLCIKPNEQGRARATDIRRIQAQVSQFDLDNIIKRKAAEFSAVLSMSDFCQRYKLVIDEYVADGPALVDDFAKCAALKKALQLSDAEMALGRAKVFVNFKAWRRIDDPIRGMERMEMSDQRTGHKQNKDAQQFGELGYGDITDTCATSFGDQSEANLMLNAQPLGHNSSSDTGMSGAAQQMRALKGRMFGAGADARSYYSDDDGYQGMGNRDGISEVASERDFNAGYEETLPLSAGDPETTKKSMMAMAAQDEPEDEPEIPETSARKAWVAFTWLCTWMIPSVFLRWCGRIKRRDQRMAWREKVALCMIVIWSCGVVIFWIVGLGMLLCPSQHVYSITDLTSHNTADDALVAIRGEVFDIKDYSHMGVQFKYLMDRNYLGRDQSSMFPYQLSFVCPFEGMDPRLSFQTKPELYSPTYYHDHRWWRHPTEKGYNYFQFRMMRIMRQNYAKGHIAVDPKELLLEGSGNSKNAMGQIIRRCIIHDQIFDLSEYINHMGVPYLVSDTQNSTNSVGTRKFLDDNVFDMFDQNPGKDITDMWDRFFADKPESKAIHTQCLRGAFYVGKVDLRKSTRCYAANYLLLAATIALVLIIFFKFLAALQFGSRRDPEPGTNFVVCNVPCYTEGEESLKQTIDSLAELKYDDKRKLLFIVCDGMIMGSGNDRPTPRIVLDILGVGSDQEPEALSYIALGEGSKEHNMAKVYSGLYEFKGHVVPYLVVAKVGTPHERNRPGNRGKRDSQIMLIRFFNKVFFDLPMTPLELEMFHQVKNVIGVNPALYEFVLMIDADTVVFSDSLSRLIGALNNDTKIIGICGETMLANAKSSWITMMQVYEYFISHHLTKAFESLFGSVTCLPGCFSMYRMRTPDSVGTPVPLLISNQIIDDYSTNRVETLHEKNLLHLGEDRYLTTLVLKHFPYYKNKFVPAAKCITNAPEELNVLLSQRRRWINSTVHNLFELVFLPQLCGFCCFSMRFVVFIDLITTIIMPATIIYLAYLIYQLVNPDSTTSYISLYLLAAIYGMQALIFILKRQWQHIGWMIVYILAIPLFSFFIPLYSFWHFDDFSWGNTRMVIGESGRKHIYTVDNEKFDKSSIPVRKWSDYEQDMLDNSKSQYAMSETGSRFGGAAALINRPGSATGNVPQSMAEYAGTNSVYYDNGYGYNMALNTNLPVNAPGIPGTTFDYLASGRSSPIQPMSGGNGQFNAYDMATMNSARMSAASTPMDPRMGQAGDGSYFQQGMLMPDPRISTAYSGMQMVPGSPSMHSQQGFAMSAYNRLPTFASSTDQATIQMGAMDTGVKSILDYSTVLSPPGDLKAMQVQQWPSGVTDDQLARHVGEIIATTDLMTITKKQVRQQIMGHFGISAEEEKARRDFINQCISKGLEQRQAENN
ncbi:hypothetical protein LPJ66_004090 [Kickxella alabastrina]|uniref:Uncharacterized protein n=1 Tax=Kickxella alabastrina TaxID=61397 RepID=A0ACC1IM40_9FUNG|nr:hypothetical protein LPJ66_004090 [Kickxella alabastrina]